MSGATNNTSTEVLPFGARSDLAKVPFAEPPVPANKPNALLGALAPSSFEEALVMAAHLSKSTLVPKAYQGPGKAGDIVIAGMWGASLRLDWLHSLKSIAVVNGNAGLWGDVGYALMLRTKQLEVFEQTWDAATETATCTIKRRGYPPQSRKFSMADARRAGLAGKGTYVSYPDVMCGWRAFWRAAKPCFADVFMGLDGAEELQDAPPEIAPIAEPQALPPPPKSAAQALGDAFGATPARQLEERPAPAAAPLEERYILKVSAREEKAAGGTRRIFWLTLKDDPRKVYTYDEAKAKEAKQLNADAWPAMLSLKPPTAQGVCELLSLAPKDAPPPEAPSAENADPGDDQADHNAGDPAGGSAE